MPYSNVSELPDYIRAKPEKTQRQWMAVWNSSYSACIDKGGDAKSCESGAFARANGVIRASEEGHEGHHESEMAFQLEKADSRVNYRAVSNDGEKGCSSCRFYDLSCMTCSLVEGTIDPRWTCDLWSEQLSAVPSINEPGGLPMPTEMDWSEQPTFQVFIDATQLFATDDFSQPQWVPFLPKPGKYAHPTFGEVVITVERNKELVASVTRKLYQENIPLDVEHETKLSGAVGWIKDMRMNEDGSADAFVAWTDRGQQLLKGGRFKYISPEWFGTWRDPATGMVYRNVVAGGAITTRPFFKEKVLRALVASETGGQVIAEEYRDFSPEQRDEMSKSGVAMPDGSYPIPDVDALRRAIQAIGRASNRAAVMAHIKKRARALGQTDMLPEDWNEKESTMADDQEVKTLTMAEVDERIKSAVDTAVEETKASFTEQLEATKAELEAAKILAASEKEARETLATELTSMQKSARHQRFVDIIAGRGGSGDGAPWAGDAEKHVAILEKLADQFGESDESIEAYVEQQNAIAAQLKESDLFKELGTSAAPAQSDPEKKLEALAQAHMKESGKSFAESYSEVLSSPEGARLYAESQRQA